MNIPAGHDRNADQIAYWNGPGGQRWADRQQAQDILLSPIADVLIDRARPAAGERVIDVGCGSGATRHPLARKVAPSGHVFAVHVSGPLPPPPRQTPPQAFPVHFPPAAPPLPGSPRRLGVRAYEPRSAAARAGDSGKFILDWTS